MKDSLPACREQGDAAKCYREHYFKPNAEILKGLASTHLSGGLAGIEEAIERMSFDFYAEKYWEGRQKGIIDFEFTQKTLDRAESSLPASIFSPECYLVFGFNTMTGAGTVVGGKPVMAIALEQVADYNSHRSYTDLLVHELHHIIRLGQKEVIEDLTGTPAGELELTLDSIPEIVGAMSLKDHLFMEGLAAVAPAIIAGEEIDDRRLPQLLFYPRDHLKRIQSQSDMLWEELKKDLHRNDPEVLYRWCFSEHYSKELDIPE